MIFWLIALVVLALDQWTKQLVLTRMDLGEVIPIWGEFFQLTSHRNRGAAWGILEDQMLFFIVVTTIVVIGIVYYMIHTLRTGRKLLPFGLALLLGGALGNFVDRVRMGEVVDFLDFVFDFRGIGLNFVYDFPIFNVADMGISIGIGIVILDTLLEGRREKRGLAHDSVDG
ncbi:signal peptidase II [Paenibacillus sp. TRM 82003]|nr:signal peptidase II [Paenibacillus sp. TRM 82003]